MQTKKTARVVGALFLVAMAASIIGGSVVDSVLSSQDLYNAGSVSKPELLIGILLELVNAIAVVGIAVLMFPILKKYSENTALGYLGFRLIEAMFCALITVTPLSLIIGADAGAGLSALRSAIVDLLIPVFFCLGAMLFYSLLYKSKLLPRFISVWGIIAVILIFTMNLFTLFQAGSLNTGMLIILAFPIILNEIFLGIWLIFKGFNPSYNTSKSA